MDTTRKYKGANGRMFSSESEAYADKMNSRNRHWGF